MISVGNLDFDLIFDGIALLLLCVRYSSIFCVTTSPTDYQGSVLDMVQQASGGKIFSEEKHIAVEQPTNTQPIVQSNIDYSMIKMIVEDCMRKYTSALKKSILSESKINENVGTLQAMKIGDKFSFITSNGDLYEAKLTFIKNMNTKKGGK